MRENSSRKNWLTWRRFFSASYPVAPRRGFTLVELLIVIAIIGILATIGGGSYLTSRLRGRDAERKGSLGQVQRAMELYYNDYNRYPDSIPWGAEWEDANGTVYMALVPQDPRAQHQYLYEVSGDGQRYRLYARLENPRDIATDLNGDGTPGDEFNGSVGDGEVKNCATLGSGTLLCNYGISSSSTNMTEAL